MKFHKVNDQIVISATPVGEEVVANMVDAFHLKKRILSILIVCAMLLAAVIPASADEKEEYLTFIKMRYKYSFDGDEIEYSNITEEDNNYKGEGGGNSGGVYYSGFRIPEEEYIKSGEYYYRKLEDGTIALLAIDLSRQLETLTIPSTIDGLTVTRIGIDAITGTRINDQDFLADCVKKVILPDTIKIVGPGIFDNSMKEITFPDGVEEIGAINRFGHRSFKKVTLPKKSLKVLADFALAGTADNSIVVPDGVVEIGFAAFLRSQVKSVTIPASVEKLGDYIFLTCSRLSSVTLKDGVPYIAKGMFYRCEKLGSIKLPKSITRIGEKAFQDCSKLSTVTFSGDQITEIAEAAFSRCSALTKITIPNGVKKIGKDAFWGCAKLSSVTIPESVEEIDNSAFDGCSEKLVINVKAGSYAEQWAVAKGIKYKAK